MGERWYLRTMSDLGPMYFRGGYRFDSDPSTFHSDWSTLPPFAHDFASREEAFEFRNDNLPRSAVRVVRVGPPRRYTLTEKGRAATETAHQRVDGTSDGSKAVPSPSARPEAVCGQAVPERVPVTGTWCGDSPVHEHAWQWRDGGLVCAHCGGRRVEAKA